MIFGQIDNQWSKIDIFVQIDNQWSKNWQQIRFSKSNNYWLKTRFSKSCINLLCWNHTPNGWYGNGFRTRTSKSYFTFAHTRTRTYFHFFLFTHTCSVSKTSKITFTHTLPVLFFFKKKPYPYKYRPVLIPWSFFRTRTRHWNIKTQWRGNINILVESR